jgi:squalene-hopene/tetraprenyl-beta-curcumene cyclase
VEWLKAVQLSDGGWGERADTYVNPALKGLGPSTASQTAWAVMGLLAAGEGGSPSTRAGVNYLLSRQLADGTWDEDEWTGTGFPCFFYLKYHYYRHYWPLMALAQYERFRRGLRP